MLTLLLAAGEGRIDLSLPTAGVLPIDLSAPLPAAGVLPIDLPLPTAGVLPIDLFVPLPTAGVFGVNPWSVSLEI